MNLRNALPLVCAVALIGGCAELGTQGGPSFGESTTSTTSQSDRYGTIARLEYVQAENKQYKLGVGTAVGAVAGGIVGSQVGDSTGATVAGAVLGGLAGTYAESKIGKGSAAQHVTVNMNSGGRITILQPQDTRLQEGMRVRVEGSGDNARVVPR